MVSHPVKIAFVTDRGYLRPTLVAMWSLLEHLSRPAEVYFWGDDLSEADWQAVNRVAAIRPDCRLITKALGAAELGAFSWESTYITAAAMGRLFLPRHVAGRILYVDGDTIIRGDVAPLFDLDLGGALIGAVRDDPTAKQMVKRGRGRKLRPAAVERVDGIAAYTDPARYFNSGVLLLDCDRIRATPGLLDRLEDVRAASAFAMGDQDHLNAIFANRTHLLNPAWNASWARAGLQRDLSRALGAEADELAPLPDTIIHFHGPRKPWLAPRRDLWNKTARATLSYRRQLRRYLRAFPDLAPPAKG